MAVQRLQSRVIEGIQQKRKLRDAYEKMKFNYTKALFNRQYQHKF